MTMSRPLDLTTPGSFAAHILEVRRTFPARRTLTGMTQDKEAKPAALPEDERARLGRVNFEAYSKARGGRNHDGSKTPAWDELPAEIRAAWAAGARAVADSHRLPKPSKG